MEGRQGRGGESTSFYFGGNPILIRASIIHKNNFKSYFMYEKKKNNEKGPFPVWSQKE